MEQSRSAVDADIREMIAKIMDGTITPKERAEFDHMVAGRSRGMRPDVWRYARKE